MLGMSETDLIVDPDFVVVALQLSAWILKTEQRNNQQGC